MFEDILDRLEGQNQNQNQRPPQRPPSPPPPPFQPQDVPRLFKELLNSFNIMEQWEKDKFENSYKWKRYNNHGPFRSIDDFWDLHGHYCDLNNYTYGYIPFAKFLKRGMINPIQLEEGDFTYGSAKMWIDTGNAIRDRETLEIAPLIVQLEMDYPPGSYEEKIQKLNRLMKKVMDTYHLYYKLHDERLIDMNDEDIRRNLADEIESFIYRYERIKKLNDHYIHIYRGYEFLMYEEDPPDDFNEEEDLNVLNDALKEAQSLIDMEMKYRQPFDKDDVLELFKELLKTFHLIENWYTHKQRCVELWNEYENEHPRDTIDQFRVNCEYTRQFLKRYELYCKIVDMYKMRLQKKLTYDEIQLYNQLMNELQEQKEMTVEQFEEPPNFHPQMYTYPRGSVDLCFQQTNRKFKLIEQCYDQYYEIFDDRYINDNRVIDMEDLIEFKARRNYKIQRLGRYEQLGNLLVLNKRRDLDDIEYATLVSVIDTMKQEHNSIKSRINELIES